MTEIAQPDPTYIQRVARSDGSSITTTSTIDRCFLSLTPAALMQVRVTGAAMARTPLLNEISDHVPVSFRVGERKRQPRHEKPWPRWIFMSKEYAQRMKERLPSALDGALHPHRTKQSVAKDILHNPPVTMLDDPEVVAIAALGLARAAWNGNGRDALLHSRRVPVAVATFIVSEYGGFSALDEQGFDIALSTAGRLPRHDGPRQKMLKVKRRQETMARWLKLWAPDGQRAALTAVLPKNASRSGGMPAAVWATSSAEIASELTAH